MIKLTFYTTEKRVVVEFDNFNNETYENTPTVQVRDGYYEVMKRNDNGVVTAVKPILRVPISQTIMHIND